MVRPSSPAWVRRSGGVASGFAQSGEGELADRVAEHLLLVGGFEVEEIVARGARLTSRPGETLGGGEGAPGPGRRATGGLAGTVQEADRGLAQPQPVDGRGGGNLVERAQADGHTLLGNVLLGRHARQNIS
jgi:hypothetical protein